MDSQEIAGIIYKAALEHYQDKMIRNAETAFPVIKNVYETQKDQYKRILVPFTDGVKTLNVATDLEKAYESKGKQLIQDFEKNISLAIIDDAWKTHLRKMDELKQSVQLAVHEQKDPLLIYKFEAFELFKEMIVQVNKDVISFLFKGELPQENQQQIREARQEKTNKNLKEQKDEIQNLDERSSISRAAGQTQGRQQQVTETIVREQPKIGRNDKVTIKHVMNGCRRRSQCRSTPCMQTSGWSKLSRRNSEHRSSMRTTQSTPTLCYPSLPRLARRTALQLQKIQSLRTYSRR